MIKADLHVHSNYSEHPSEWFLQRIGTRESYTEIEEVYRRAKIAGMDFITLTDHNTIEGALRLKELHPEDTFVSTEATTYFPENGCKIHLLVFDIDEEQAEEINRIRENIYELREYLVYEDIACSVAHGTFGVNGRLCVDTLEKLVLLFDVFETINGARNRIFNQTWYETLRNLTPETISRLVDKHNIQPWSNAPWIKGFTGGSDDHSGLFIADAFTITTDSGMGDFIDSLKRKDCIADGRHGDYKSLAFSLYKIAYEFSKQGSAAESSGFLNMINAILFDNGKLGFKNWMAVQKMKIKRDSTDNRILLRFFEDMTGNRIEENRDIREQMNGIYDGISRFADEFFRMILESLEKDLKNGQAGKLLKHFSAALPAIFLTAPFISTMHHQYNNRELLRELRKRFKLPESGRDRKMLWFSDTVTDLNGVSVTMRNLAAAAGKFQRDMKIVTTLPPEEYEKAALPENIINLPCIYHVTPDFYNAFTFRVPSMLRALERIAEENPDEIVISTPGPVGLTALAAAKLLDIPCTGIYHTDFSMQADHFIGDEWVSNIIENYTRWFYRSVDVARVPSRQYIELLECRGFDPKKMKLFKRGIDMGFVKEDPKIQSELVEKYALRDAFVMMYSGRLGKEKNLDLLIDLYEKMSSENDNIRLLIAGDGPEYEKLKSRAVGHEGIVMTGRLDREELSYYYAVSHIFVFPSVTDTFGMAVLEAQACGLPALVTDRGGPQEIVRDKETGDVISAPDIDKWVSIALSYRKLLMEKPDEFRKLRRKISGIFQARYGWEVILNEFMGEKPVGRPENWLPKQKRWEKKGYALVS